MITRFGLFEQAMEEDAAAGRLRDEAVSFLRNKAAYALVEGWEPTLYRGISKVAGPWYMQAPREAMRNSKNTTNEVSMLMNSGAAWAAYPKREVIASSERFYASTYAIPSGGVYVVVPPSDAPVGQCASDDLFNSFKHVQEVYAVPRINFLIRSIWSETTDKTMSQLPQRDAQAFRAELEKASDSPAIERAVVRLENKWSEDDLPSSKNNLALLLLRFKTSGKKFLQWLEEDIVNPDVAGFSVCSAAEMKPVTGGNSWTGTSGESAQQYERWCEPPCLMVHEAHVARLLDLARHK